jgi:hypothetical protein
MLARLLFCQQLHFNLSQLISKTAEIKDHHVSELGHLIFPYGYSSQDPVNNLRSLFALAFRGKVRQTTEFYTSLIPLVPVSAENDIGSDPKEPEAEKASAEEMETENATEAIQFPFSPSLNLAMQRTSVLTINHEHLGTIPEFLSGLPAVLLKNIKHFYVTDFDSQVFLPGYSSQGSRNRYIKRQVDWLQNASFIQKMKETGVTLILKEYDIERLNESASIIHSIETGKLQILQLDHIDNILLHLGSKLNALIIYGLSDIAITRLFELESTTEYFPGLVWDILIIHVSAPTVISADLVKFLKTSKYLKIVRKLESDELAGFFDDTIQGAWESQFLQNSPISYKEFLSTLFFRGLESMKHAWIDSFEILNELGSDPSFICPKKLNIDQAWHLDLTFLQTSGWKKLEDLTVTGELLNRSHVIPENIKRFNLISMISEYSLDIASETVILNFCEIFPRNSFKEGKVKHISIENWYDSYIDIMPFSLETLKIGSMAVEKYHDIAPRLINTLVDKRPRFKVLEIQTQRLFERRNLAYWIGIDIQVYKHPKFSVRYSHGTVVYKRLDPY